LDIILGQLLPSFNCFGQLDTIGGIRYLLQGSVEASSFLVLSIFRRLPPEKSAGCAQRQLHQTNRALNYIWNYHHSYLFGQTRHNL
ncbi:hypothetical protein, partial [Enorma massiliensis]|uniref:hypothetical protein n=1 Tax=Enorma massiliensis TaxID=1472761 RepID=UPI003A951BE2